MPSVSLRFVPRHGRHRLPNQYNQRVRAQPAADLRLRLCAVLLTVAVLACRRTGVLPGLPTPLAPTEAAILGSLRDGRTGQPLSHVLIRLVGTTPPGLVSDSATTDQHGRFVLGPVPGGEYEVSVAYPGYHSIAAHLRLHGSQTDTLLMHLPPLQPPRLEQTSHPVTP